MLTSSNFFSTFNPIPLFEALPLMVADMSYCCLLKSKKKYKYSFQLKKKTYRLLESLNEESVKSINQSTYKLVRN